MPFDGNPENPDVLIIEKAQEILLTGGWCRHSMSFGAEHCVIGAIRAANYGEIPGIAVIHDALLDELRERRGPIPSDANGWFCAAMWNDYQAFDLKQVVGFLDCVKARIKEKSYAI